MFLIKKKILYYLFLIITIILIFSCAEDFKGQICITNRCSYYSIDVKVGDIDFHTIEPETTTLYKSINPGTYRIKGTINLNNDLFKDIEINKTIQVNILRKYTIRIKNNGTSNSNIVIKED